MKATQAGGQLQNIDNCYIVVGVEKIIMNILPDISDSKTANYSEESSIGRSNPFKTFNSSENRSISWTCHFVVTEKDDFDRILKHLRLLESAVYPTEGSGGVPYLPPPVCKLKCGEILGNLELCVVMKQYSVKFDPSVPWHPIYMLPYKLDVDLTFEVVYNQNNLPNSRLILERGM
jgi:hypothetical protein